MSFGDYWYGKQRTNPKLCSAEKIALTVESFRKELEKAFMAGKREGMAENRESAGPDDIFRRFGGKP